jgi:hypothetical protein
MMQRSRGVILLLLLLLLVVAKRRGSFVGEHDYYVEGFC